MKLKIERISGDARKPHPDARFTHFDDTNGKHYTIELDTIEQLLDIVKYNNTDISIFPPVDDEPYTIYVNDVQ